MEVTYLTDFPLKRCANKYSVVIALINDFKQIVRNVFTIIY